MKPNIGYQTQHRLVAIVRTVARKSSICGNNRESIIPNQKSKLCNEILKPQIFIRKIQKSIENPRSG